MKKILIITGISLLSGLTTVFAGEGKKVNDNVVGAFNREFAGATTITWQMDGDFAKATFLMNNQVMYAYYNAETSELVAVARNLLSDRLPIRLMASLKSDFAGYWITDLVELSRNGETTYYATLENEGKQIVLRSGEFNDWTVEKKVKKN